MPRILEIFGHDPQSSERSIVTGRKSALCPYTEAVCDGGGNRHQTKIKLAKSELRNYFDPNLESVVPGICSIEYGGASWIVCPRRLFGFSPQGQSIPRINHTLKTHEKTALTEAGLPKGIDLGVWAEVYLKLGSEDSEINYHFDFVIAPITTGKTFNDLIKSYRVEDAETQSFVKAAKVGGYIKGRYDFTQPLAALPDLTAPIIIEVMTASTSGSDTEQGTDIASSFTKAIQGRPHVCPGINKRQVWGRMATQLFAKSALAESWGGKTIWLVQDQLLKNIELTTKLSLRKTPSAKKGTVNFLSMKYIENGKGLDAVVFDSYMELTSGLSFSENRSCTDILLSKINPDKKELLKAVLRRPLSARLRL
jgi:hypothetical protein